jgi:tetratricopeptide (TPR) repeat protein
MTAHLARIALVVVAAVGLSTVRLAAQESPRALFEAGNLQGVIDQVPDDASPDALYLKGLALRKLGMNDPAKDVFGRLAGGGDAWRATGESAVAQIDGNLDAALAAATAAVAANGMLAEAHYQLGLVLEARGDAGAAAEAFANATIANPMMAYAHYNAGMNYYKVQRIDRMAVFFENFLRLAPQAPERPAVDSIMRTVRGR